MRFKTFKTSLRFVQNDEENRVLIFLYAKLSEYLQ